MSEENKKNVPENITGKIQDLRRLEMLLGHLPNENWTVNELQKRTEDASYQQSLSQMETKTELLFAEICEELMQHNFSDAEIAQAINSEISLLGKMKYCNEIEVREALGKH